MAERHTIETYGRAPHNRNIWPHTMSRRNRNRNRNRNLKTSKALLKSQAHQGTSLFTSAATNQRGGSKGGSREAQVRIPEYQEGTEELLGWVLLRWGGGMITRVRVGEIEEMRF